MRKRRTAVLVPVLLGLLVPLSGCGASAHSSEPDGWTVHSDANRALSVELPSGWHRARESLTPNLVDPREVLSVGSYPLRFDRRGRCQVPSCPVPALNGFTRADVLISIQERRLPDRVAFPLTRGSGFSARQHPFQLRRMRLSFTPGERRFRCAERKLGWTAWTPFGESGRAFYAFVAVGRGASRETRRDMRHVLESLRFGPRESALTPPP